MEINEALKQLNIVKIVTYTYPSTGNGLGNVALAQAEELVRQGHTVTVISANEYRGNDHFERNGVRHIKLSASNFLNRFSIPVPLFIFNAEVISLLKQADIVHAHDMLYPSTLQAALLSKVFKKNFVLTQHTGTIHYNQSLIDLIQKTIRKTLGELVLHLSERIVVINEGVVQEIDETHSSKIVSIPNGVDISLFHHNDSSTKELIREKFGLPIDKPIVLFVGRLVAKKGVWELLEAKDDQYTIVLVGGGPLLNELTNHADKNVCILGALSQEDLSQVYQASDMFVLPSYCEGFPLSIQEAMASGLPIITTKQPGYELYLDEKYVQYIEPTADSIRTAINNLIENDIQKEQMSSYSKEAARASMSWQENVEKLTQVYRKILNKNY